MASKKASSIPPISYKPLNSLQLEIREKWENSRIMMVMGRAGHGKTTAVVAESIIDLQRGRKKKLLLAHPQVETEHYGFEPGDLNEKLLSWQGPILDVYDGLAEDDLKKYLTAPNCPIEMRSVGRAKGRTVRNATLLVDEAQDLSLTQLKVLTSRVGENGRLVLIGDETQSDLRYSGTLPLTRVRSVYQDMFTIIEPCVDCVNLRDPLIDEIVSRFRDLDNYD